MHLQIFPLQFISVNLSAVRMFFSPVIYYKETKKLSVTQDTLPQWHKAHIRTVLSEYISLSEAYIKNNEVKLDYF